jgi:hypothetical protein
VLFETAEAKLFRHSFMLKTAYLTKKYYVEVFKGFRGLIETAESAFAVSLKRGIGFHGHIKTCKPITSKNFLEFLGEFDAIFKTALARESGP